MIDRKIGLFLLIALVLFACDLPLVIDGGQEQPSLPTPPDGLPLTETPVSVEPTMMDPSPTLTSLAPVDEPGEESGEVPEEPEIPTPLPVDDQLPVFEIPPFILQPGSPVALPNFAHPELGCSWMGVAGQIFDTASNPVKFIVVEMGGDLVGVEVSQLSLSGSAPIYGPSGFEFSLASRPIGSIGTLWLRLFNLQGEPLTGIIPFDTFNDCSKNLVLINFLELPTLENRFYLPGLMNSRILATPEVE